MDPSKHLSKGLPFTSFKNRQWYSCPSGTVQTDTLFRRHTVYETDKDFLKIQNCH